MDKNNITGNKEFITAWAMGIIGSFAALFLVYVLVFKRGPYSILLKIRIFIAIIIVAAFLYYLSHSLIAKK